MRILITSGATREPIDGVRFISNFSSGGTGAFLSDYFRSKGHDVFLAHGKGSKLPDRVGPSYEFTTFKDLESLLKMLLSEEKFDAVFQLAAISDFSIESLEYNGKSLPLDESYKLSSNYESLTLRLKKNAKLIGQLREFSRHKNFVLVGFKLTNNASKDQRHESVCKLSSQNNIDYIVQNDLSEIKGDQHIATFYKGGQPIAQSKNKEELAQELEKLLQEPL